MPFARFTPSRTVFTLALIRVLRNWGQLSLSGYGKKQRFICKEKELGRQIAPLSHSHLSLSIRLLIITYS
jgi:hypothetical protein